MLIDTNNLIIQEKLAKALKYERLDAINKKCICFEFRDTFYSKYIKRLLDILIALFIFIITLPINIILALLTLLILGTPILFYQDRVGKNGKSFKLVKFRNMTNETNEDGELLPASQRLTRFGVFVRKTSLDELLNMLSVIKGDMSLIGPRALPEVYNERYSNRHRLRLCVKPGLECPPDCRLQKERIWNEQFENDLWYVQNISFKTDCIMTLRLIRFVFDRENAKIRSKCKKGSFLGYSWEGKAISNYDLSNEEVNDLLSNYQSLIF